MSDRIVLRFSLQHDGQSDLLLLGVADGPPAYGGVRRPFFVGSMGAVTMRRPFDVERATISVTRVRVFFVWGGIRTSISRPFDLGTSGLLVSVRRPFDVIRVYTGTPVPYGYYTTHGFVPGIQTSQGAVTLFSDDAPRTKVINQAGSWGFSMPQHVVDTATGDLVENAEANALTEDTLVWVSNQLGTGDWVGNIDRITRANGKVTVECSDVFTLLALHQLKDFPPEPDPAQVALYGDRARQIIWNPKAGDFLKQALAGCGLELDIQADNIYYGQLAYSGTAWDVLTNVAEHAFVEFTYEGMKLIVRDQILGAQGAPLSDGPGGCIVAGPTYLRDVSPVVNALTVKGTPWQVPVEDTASQYISNAVRQQWVNLGYDPAVLERATASPSGVASVSAIEYQPVARVEYSKNGLRRRWQEVTLDSPTPAARSGETKYDPPTEAPTEQPDIADLLRQRHWKNFIKAYHDMYRRPWGNPEPPEPDGDEYWLLSRWFPHRTVLAGGGIQLGLGVGDQAGREYNTFYNGVEDEYSGGNQPGQPPHPPDQVNDTDPLPADQILPYEKALYETYDPRTDGVGVEVNATYVEGKEIKSGPKWVVAPYPDMTQDVAVTIQHGFGTTETLIWVDYPSKLPAAPYYCKALSEVFKVVGYSGLGGLIIERGQNGTTATEHRKGETLTWTAPKKDESKDEDSSSSDQNDKKTYVRRVETDFPAGYKWGLMYCHRSYIAERTLNLRIANVDGVWDTIKIGSRHHVSLTTEGVEANVRVTGIAPAEYSGTMEINVEILDVEPGGPIPPPLDPTLPPVPSVPRWGSTNLVTNSTFEAGLTGWAADPNGTIFIEVAGTLSRIAGGHSGSGWLARVTPPLTGTFSSFGAYFSFGTRRFVAGKTYKVSGYLRHPAGALSPNRRIGLAIYSLAHLSEGNRSITIVSTSDWQYIEFEWTPRYDRTDVGIAVYGIDKPVEFDDMTVLESL